MSQKVSTYVSLICIVLFGLWYTYEINSAANQSNSPTLGPQFFPNILFSLLVLLCIWCFIKTFRKKDSLITMPSMKLLLVTIGLIILFVWSWSSFGWVYVHSFLFLNVLLFLYSQKKITTKLAFANITISLGVTVFLYLLFTVLISVNF